MIVAWTQEAFLATALIFTVFLISAYWSKKWLRIVFLMLGFLGFWLAVIDPSLKIEKDLKTTDVRDIPTFLIPGLGLAI